MVEIDNASPRVIDLGTRDLSMPTQEVSSLATPQHMPKFYIYASSGVVGPQYVELEKQSLTSAYGNETFNVKGKYYTHQTAFLQCVAKNGNNCVVQRLIPPDAKDRANVIMYLDVLPTQVPVYTKQVDGSVMLDGSGNPVPQLDGAGDPVTVAGYKVCWIPDYKETALGGYEVGLASVRQGVQVDGATQSTQYPMFEIPAKFVGEDGMKLAACFYAAMKTDLYTFPAGFLNDGKVFPYYFKLKKLVNPSTGRIDPVLNGYGAQFARFTMKEGSVDPVSGISTDFKETMDSQYTESVVAGSTGLGVTHTYFSNINIVAQMLYNAEKVISDNHRDDQVNSVENNIYALNMLSFTSSNGSPYQAVKLVDTVGSLRLTRNTNIFLKGAFDGTITNGLLDQQVAEDMAMYDDPTSEYNDMVMHPASTVYDSGFSMATKLTLPKMIAYRKDTFVTLSTYAWNNTANMLADQISIGIALKTMLEMYPESDHFGTPVMRGMILVGSGTILNHSYKKRLPMSYELAYMASRFMGATSGAWKNGFLFDKVPLNIISQMENLDTTWVPTPTRAAMWTIGLNFPLNYQIKRQFFPALQTAYPYDTSVLNSYFTVVACSYLNKIAHAAWRQFTGAISLTPAQLEDAVNLYVSNAVKDKFDGLFKIVPMAKVTEFDARRGYSWTLPIKIGANNMMTVMTTYTEGHRLTDMPA